MADVARAAAPGGPSGPAGILVQLAGSSARWWALCIAVGAVVIAREALKVDVTVPRRPAVTRVVRPGHLARPSGQTLAGGSPGGSRSSDSASAGQEPVATPASMPSSAAELPLASLRPTQLGRATDANAGAFSSARPDTATACPSARVVARTGAWSRAGQRLGNTLCMLGRALREAEDAGGGVLELLAPGNRFYNATTFCVAASPESKDSPPPDKVLEGTFSCYTPCTCGANRFERFRNALQLYVLPNFMVKPSELGDDVLVIHVRSGDVMRTTRGVKYWQPPVKYYKYIIETFHPNAEIILATEEHGEADGVVGGNPIVKRLLKWRPSIMFPPAHFHADVATLLGARSLVQAISSFSVTLAIMSPRLRRTYVPRPVSLRDRDKECCSCGRSGADGGALPKEWNCGADKGWPQEDGSRVEIVQILLAGYNPGDQHNFTQKSAILTGWDGPVCHNTFPRPPS